MYLLSQQAPIKNTQEFDEATLHGSAIYRLETKSGQNEIQIETHIEGNPCSKYQLGVQGALILLM
ncbi:MAG: hypothetical protein CL607_11650 [Anaerolineaceae bacterium]|nr:hypothetical protein [Anaerolineaceae bacterium]